VPVTKPKLLESKFVPGLSECGVFVTLNASAHFQGRPVNRDGQK